MKKLLLNLAKMLPLILVAVCLHAGSVHAYTNSDLIDDPVFDNANSMSAAQIQTFLNQFPNSCLKSYQTPDPQSWYTYGGNVSAAQAIYDTAHIWGINPQVILTTLEKEEGLVDGAGAYGCSATAYWSAMGYNCPGSATYTYTAAQITASPDNYTGGLPANMANGAGPTCPASASDVGFSAQINHGAWQLEFGRYRSESDGNLNWDGDNAITYYGYMTQGSRARYQGGPVNYYSGSITLDDNTTLTVANGATASLYSYTPYIQSFSRIFEQFFGAGSTSANPYAATYHSQSTWPTLAPGASSAAFFEYQNTGSQTWYDDSSIGSAPVGTYPVHLATAEPLNRADPFGASWNAAQNRPATTFAAVYDADGATLAPNQHEVLPGEIGKFSFTLTAGSSLLPGVYQEAYQPVAEGSSNGLFADPGTYLDITVTSVYSTTSTGQSAPPTVPPAQTVTSTIAYQNTGNAPWYDDLSVFSAPGTDPVHLATSHALNRASIFGANWGANHNRPALVFTAVYQANGTTLAPNQDVVQPGQIGVFGIPFTTPAQQASGTYQEYFQPVVEGTSDGAFNDPGTSITVTVPSITEGAATPASTNQVNMAPGTSQQFTASFTNVGNTTWTSSTTKLVGNPSTSYQSFKDTSWASSTTLASLNQTSIAPGATGTFTFTLAAPNGGGSYYLELAPSNDGSFSTPTPAKYQVTVAPPVYSAQYTGQSSYPTLFAGTTATGYFTYKNTGNVTWYDDTSIGTAPAGSYPVHLATSAPTNRASVFGASWGANHNRPTLTFTAVYQSDGVTLTGNQHAVQPGQIVKMGFTLAAPAGQAPGTYQEGFQPVAEGSSNGLFADPGTYLDVTVASQTYVAQFAGQSAYPSIARGNTATGYFLYKNVGNQSWYDDASMGSGPSGLPVHLATSHPINRASILGSAWGANANRPATTFAAVYESDGTTLAANQHVVQPGQIAKFSFTLTTSSSTALGTDREYFQPVLEGTPDGAFNDPGTYLDVTVTP
jgi:hypothetical protein